MTASASAPAVSQNNQQMCPSSDAVVATMNVGSFSALNGVAGAYAERLPVIFVASGYNTNDASTSHLLHHSLGTRDLSYQDEMVKYVTAPRSASCTPATRPR
jgi:TPP-dependent 2-oxoacid decarboxylase